jgi:rod shape-determining protein MreD
MHAAGSPVIARDAGSLGPLVSVAAVVAALALQVYLPQYFGFIGNLDLPLLVAVYLALMSRSAIVGLLIGAVIGIAQDSLTDGPVGVFGILKTVIGYLAGTISLYIEVDYPGARSVLVALFFLIHQILFWIVETVLLGSEISIQLVLTLILAAAHAGLSLAVFRLLDGLKKTP